jgi:hypothetical protein
MTPEFWDPIFKDTDFKEFVRSSYQIGGESMELDLDLESE